MYKPVNNINFTIYESCLYEKTKKYIYCSGENRKQNSCNSLVISSDPLIWLGKQWRKVNKKNLNIRKIILLKSVRVGQLE